MSPGPSDRRSARGAAGAAPATEAAPRRAPTATPDGPAPTPPVDGSRPGGVLRTTPPPLARYADLGIIAVGGMGEVRRVHDLQLDRVLAMKIVRSGATDDERVRRFMEEARATASLQHPGIVPVHDCGALADGRLWFTMKEVRGRTLRAVIADVHGHGGPGRWGEAPGGWTLRRLVDALRRACEAVGYAHARGVLHRDLKPDNLMVGEHGEVLVLDWGIARDSRDRARAPDAAQAGSPELLAADPVETRVGAVMGTPAYMAPEQADGRVAAHGPPTDVFALGMVLHEILTGRTPRQGSPLQVWHLAATGVIPRASAVAPRDHPPLPDELVDICERATAAAPQHRHPDAGALAVDLADWLDGARREADALAQLARAEAGRPAIAALRARAAAHRRRAARIASDLAPWSPVADKAPAWAEEDAAERLEAEADLAEAGWLQQVQAALEVAPQLTALHDALAGFHAGALRRAEHERHTTDAARAEAALRRHDRGRFTHLLTGLGAVTLVTDPPGARVTAWRMERQQRRLVPVRDRVLGQTPLREVPLPFGSWLLIVERDGHAPVRYPVSIGRGEHWDGVPPDASAPLAIPLPAEGALGAEDRYVPAGWAWTGGDPDAADGLPLRRLWVDGLVVRAVPATVADWLRFLGAVAADEGIEAARALAPREPQSRARTAAAVVGLEEGPGGFALATQGDHRWDPRHPITLVDWHAARRYARWWATRTRLPWRLPDELEWEKAARGVDGRRLVWGDTLEPTWANVLGHSRGDAALATVDAFPEDCSVYGVRGLMGNVRDRCTNLWRHEGPRLDGERVAVDAADPADPGWRSARGGAWTSAPNLGRPASRFADLPEHRSWALGVRLVRSV